MDIKLEELYQMIGEKVIIIFKLEQQLKEAIKRIELLESEMENRTNWESEIKNAR